jgi:bifunctional UDP-N-acetylglucosamine pyrophosphorylase/glucosamine-1-phosphate N-acetyltransferase
VGDGVATTAPPDRVPSMVGSSPVTARPPLDILVLAPHEALLPALGLPLVLHVLRTLRGIGARRVVAAPRDAEAVLAGEDAEVLGVDLPADLPRALLALAPKPDRTLLVVRGDLPLLTPTTVAALLAQHEAGGVVATVCAAEGGVLALGAFETRRLAEALAAATAGGVVELVASLRAAGHAAGSFSVPDAEEIRPVATLADVAEASRRLRERRLLALLAAGVQIEDPATTAVGPDAVVDAGALLRAFTLLEGRTVVRSGAAVGPFVRLVDTEVGPDAQVLDHCLLRECVVEAGASVGPFAHVRPESRIGAGARVGNFVELKKTALGAGAKAPHLSYLGDADIGPRVNVGAGTITCNYDGVAKHPTRIEAGAFVGSDTTLVAPVTVGEGAYVAAGSTITEDVPPHALALGRARQVVKPGWAERRRGRGRSRE